MIRSLQHLKVGIGLLSILALGSMVVARAATPVARLIVPGTSVGHLHLNKDIEAETRKMGEPTVNESAAGSRYRVWVSKSKTAKHLDTLYVCGRTPVLKSMIEAIHVTSPFFRTRNGISTNSTLAQVKKAFPRLKRAVYFQGAIIYDDARHGIAFEFPHDHASARCMGITAYIPGDGVYAGGPVTCHEVERWIADPPPQPKQ